MAMDITTSTEHTWLPKKVEITKATPQKPWGKQSVVSDSPEKQYFPVEPKFVQRQKDGLTF